MPPRAFPSLEGTALEERNVRHVFKRLLKRASCGRSEFTTCGSWTGGCGSSGASSREGFPRIRRVPRVLGSAGVIPSANGNWSSRGSHVSL
jgi:hypothetical protein